MGSAQQSPDIPDYCNNSSINCPECLGQTTDTKIHPQEEWIKGPLKFFKRDLFKKRDKYEYRIGDPRFVDQGFQDHEMRLLNKLSYGLYRDIKRPNPNVTVLSYAGNWDEDEMEMKFEEIGIARGGPNSTKRCGGGKAFHFGQADSAGRSEMSEASIEFYGRERHQRKRALYAQQKVVKPELAEVVTAAIDEISIKINTSKELGTNTFFNFNKRLAK